jgi:hypothetical protein
MMGRPATERPLEPYVFGDLGMLYAKSKDGWQVVEFDAEDFDKVSNHNWRIDKDGYVITEVSKIRTSMHRLLTNAVDKTIDVDHINNIRTCNLKSNLRAVCRSTNNTNPKAKVRSDNTTGYRGVFRKRDKWGAHFKWKGKVYRKGGFATPEEAAHQYDLFVIEFGPPLAKLNFPERHGR